jgi:hypothetical protein
MTNYSNEVVNPFGIAISMGVALSQEGIDYHTPLNPIKFVAQRISSID